MVRTRVPFRSREMAGALIWLILVIHSRGLQIGPAFSLF